MKISNVLKTSQTIKQTSLTSNALFALLNLHQRIMEHPSSRPSIIKYMRQPHELDNISITENFTVLRKRRNKFDCLLYEMLFKKELKPSLNVHKSDSITPKVF